MRRSARLAGHASDSSGGGAAAAGTLHRSPSPRKREWTAVPVDEEHEGRLSSEKHDMAGLAALLLGQARAEELFGAALEERPGGKGNGAARDLRFMHKVVLGSLEAELDSKQPGTKLQRLLILTPELTASSDAAFVSEQALTVASRTPVQVGHKARLVAMMHTTDDPTREGYERLFEGLHDLRLPDGRERLWEQRKPELKEAKKAAKAAERQLEYEDIKAQLEAKLALLFCVHYQGLRPAGEEPQQELPFAFRRRLFIKTDHEGALDKPEKALRWGEEEEAKTLPLPSFLPASRCHKASVEGGAAADLGWTWLANAGHGLRSYPVGSAHV